MNLRKFDYLVLALIFVSTGCSDDDSETPAQRPDSSDVIDLCPEDPNKTAPGVCGCNVPDTDSDGDDTPDCSDRCPTDPNKMAPGVCGCNIPDTDSGGNPNTDCLPPCPDDFRPACADGIYTHCLNGVIVSEQCNQTDQKCIKYNDEYICALDNPSYNESCKSSDPNGNYIFNNSCRESDMIYLKCITGDDGKPYSIEKTAESLCSIEKGRAWAASCTDLTPNIVSIACNVCEDENGAAVCDGQKIMHTPYTGDSDDDPMFECSDHLLHLDTPVTGREFCHDGAFAVCNSSYVYCTDRCSTESAGQKRDICYDDRYSSSDNQSSFMTHEICTRISDDLYTFLPTAFDLCVDMCNQENTSCDERGIYGEIGPSGYYDCSKATTTDDNGNEISVGDYCAPRAAVCDNDYIYCVDACSDGEIGRDQQICIDDKTKNEVGDSISVIEANTCTKIDNGLNAYITTHQSSCVDRCDPDDPTKCDRRGIFGEIGPSGYYDCSKGTTTDDNGKTISVKEHCGSKAAVCDADGFIYCSDTCSEKDVDKIQTICENEFQTDSFGNKLSVTISKKCSRIDDELYAYVYSSEETCVNQCDPDDNTRCDSKGTIPTDRSYYDCTNMKLSLQNSGIVTGKDYCKQFHGEIAICNDTSVFCTEPCPSTTVGSLVQACTLNDDDPDNIYSAIETKVCTKIDDALSVYMTETELCVDRCDPDDPTKCDKRGIYGEIGPSGYYDCSKATTTDDNGNEISVGDYCAPRAAVCDNEYFYCVDACSDGEIGKNVQICIDDKRENEVGDSFSVIEANTCTKIDNGLNAYITTHQSNCVDRCDPNDPAKCDKRGIYGEIGPSGYYDCSKATTTDDNGKTISVKEHCGSKAAVCDADGFIYCSDTCSEKDVDKIQTICENEFQTDSFGNKLSVAISKKCSRIDDGLYAYMYSSEETCVDRCDPDDPAKCDKRGIYGEIGPSGYYDCSRGTTTDDNGNKISIGDYCAPRAAVCDNDYFYCVETCHADKIGQSETTCQDTQYSHNQHPVSSTSYRNCTQIDAGLNAYIDQKGIEAVTCNDKCNPEHTACEDRWKFVKDGDLCYCGHMNVTVDSKTIEIEDYCGQGNAPLCQDKYVKCPPLCPDSAIGTKDVICQDFSNGAFVIERMCSRAAGYSVYIDTGKSEHCPNGCNADHTACK